MIKHCMRLLVCGLLLSGCLSKKTAAPTLKNTAPSIRQEKNVEQPMWTLGDKWIWSDGYGLEVTDIQNGITTFDRTDIRGQWHKSKGIFKEESQSASTHRKSIFRSADPEKTMFPLKKGNSAVFRREYLANGELRTHLTSWTVDGQEKITVPAATFDCWVLTMRTRGIETGWTGYEKWWYSPKVKNYVRLEYRYGESPAGVRVLTEYQVH